MGLDILTERLQKIRSDSLSSGRAVRWTVGGMICLDEFLKLLAKNLAALAQFKTLLMGLIITASEAVAALNLIVAQLETANNVANTFLQTFKSAKRAALSSLIPFPFGSDTFSQCPPVQEIKEFITSQIPKPDPSSLLPGNAKRYAKKYKQATQAFKELEYRIYSNQKKIGKLRIKIQDIQTQILAWQAVVDAITAQFGI